jgi:hypothetical protein
MGYIRYNAEKAAVHGGLKLIGWCLLAIPFIWPLMLSNKIGAGWAGGLEVVWLALLVAAFLAYRSRMIERQRAEQERAATVAQSVAKHRALMAQTNKPWFDSLAGHYRHGTCTIKHRSEGAAGRCSSAI